MTQPCNSIRYDRLQKAFQKAMDLSFNSVGEDDLIVYFGEVKEKFGNVLQRLFVNNMLSKTLNNTNV